MRANDDGVKKNILNFINKSLFRRHKGGKKNNQLDKVKTDFLNVDISSPIYFLL